MLRKSLTALVALTLVSPAVAADVALKSTLTGSPTTDVDGSGTATVTIDPASGKVCYTLEVKNIDPALAAHIHKGAAGAGGPPVVPLDAPANGKSQGCTSVSPDVAASIVADPAGYYVNVHTKPFMGGAIRGQLSK